MCRQYPEYPEYPDRLPLEYQKLRQQLRLQQRCDFLILLRHHPLACAAKLPPLGRDRRDATRPAQPRLAGWKLSHLRLRGFFSTRFDRGWVAEPDFDTA